MIRTIYKFSLFVLFACSTVMGYIIDKFLNIFACHANVAAANTQCLISNSLIYAMKSVVFNTLLSSRLPLKNFPSLYHVTYLVEQSFLFCAHSFS